MIDSKILQRALDWNKYPKGIRIFLDTEVSSIQNTEVRDAILLDEKKQALAPKFYRGKKRKTWYDSSSNAIHVILSNIESPRELDRVILNEVLLRRGLAGLVGDDVMNRIANAVFNGQDEQTRKTFLSYVLGNKDMETDRIAAGKLYLRSQANQYAKAVTSQSKENAGKAWYSMVRKYIRPYAPQLFSFLSEETSLSHIIGAGIRAHAFYDSYSAKMSEVSSSRVRDEIVKLYNRELEGRTLDLGRYIHLGRPGDILLASAPWTKTCPVILPLVSLYENMEDGRHERYITSVEDIKKEKHPFSLLQVLNLRDELESPLAVFKSVKRDRGLVFMLPSKGGKTADASKMEHFAVPISLQEINYTENSGLRKSYGSGKWVNYIHSIYPKNDSGYLCWLSVPGLCSYLSPSFEEKWLKPAETRLEERFEHLFNAEGIKKPSAGEIKEILNNLSADDYIDIKSKLAKFQDLNEAGLPKVYSVYRDVLESATKIVKEFENPKIISQKNIEFSIQDEDLSPRMMMEKVLGEFMENNPEKLRRIAYLCVKGSPAFGNELPPVNPVSYVADMQYGELKETIMEHWPKLSEDARISIHAEFPELPNLSLDENTKYEDARKLFFTLTLDDKCRFMGFDGKNDAWKDLMNWHPLGGPDWKLDEDMLSGGIDDMFNQATAEEVIEKYIEWKNDGFKASETYALAKDITMFMVNKLNEHGIKTVMVPEDKAREILEKERGSEGEGLAEHQKKAEFQLSNGTVYGYQTGDTIYLTPKGVNPNTPIHEYAHLWAKVYEKLRPEEWESLKEELKALPQWKEIAESESYSFIESDEDRLAGEVLATIVGNKGEELMLSAARDTLEEGKRTDESVAKGAEYFRQLVTDMAVKDVFDAEGMERTGEVTLKVLKDFAEGKGVKVSKEEGKKLAAMAEFERNRVKTTEYISKSNSRFNEELQKQIDGEFDSEPHTYNLGYPGPILRSTGIPNLPIQVTSTKLYEKPNSDKHKYALDEIKDLVKHINTPVAVFSYGDGTLAQNIIIDIEHDNSHFLVGMSLNAHIKGSALEINSIRNVFPKDNYKWMEWIQEGKSRYMDKEKIKVLIAQQRTSPADVNHLDLDFVANIVEKFENPKVDEKYFIIDNWQYYGVFLDDRAQSIIDREFRELIPSGWRKHADHVTVLYNDYSNDMIAKGRSLAKTLGQERTMRIVALGKSDTAIALMVEGVETENKIAHITLATSPDGKPVDSNFITEWKPVEQIDISGRLGLSYKGKKYFEVLSDNDVVDFQINKNNMAKQVQQQSSEKKDATVAFSGLVKDVDFKTLQKAALFAAWETREGNPYEFVVDMSRNELAEFLVNAEKKLNDEDRDIVSKILSHEPGYGEDYVEKQMNAKQSFRPDIETLLVDDLTVGGDVLDRAFFYLATKDMNDAQLQQLRDNVRKKAVDFYSNMDKKNDLPGHKDTEKFVDKQLHSWFRPWTRLAGKLEHQLDEIHMSDSGPVSLKDIETTARDAMADPAYANYINKELKGWIRNRCADYGLDYTKLPEDLQYEGAAETYRQMFPEYVKDTKIDTLTRDAIKAGKDFEIVDKPVEADRDADRYPLGIEFREIYPDWVKDGYDAVWAAEHGLMVHVCSQTRRELSIGSVTDEKIEAQIDEMALFQYHVLEGHDKYEHFPDFRYSKFKPHWLDDRSRYNFLVDRALENISVSLLDNPVSQGLPDFVKKDFIRNLFSEFDAKRFSVSEKSLFCYSDDNGLIQPLEVTLSRNGTPLVVVGDRILHQFNPDIETLTRDAILAHIDKITALYPQYPQVPTKVSLKPDGSIVRQYGEFEYEQIKGGFERSKNLVLVEELDGETLQRKALYSMSSDSYGEHPNGPYVRFWDNGSIRSYENCSVRVGSDNGFESDMLSFTREGIVQEKIPGDYPIEPFLEDITNEYMKTMTKREGLEQNATANKIDSALLSTWFISLSLEDKMRVFGYYHNNPENENSPIGDDIEKLEAAYKEAVEAPHDVPEVEEIVIRKGIEERLASAFESLSDDSKGQIYRETVESGIPGLNQAQRSILNDAHTAKMNELLTKHQKEVKILQCIKNGSDIPEGVTQVEKILLEDSASLVLPKDVTQVGRIELYDSASLTLPEGVTQVGDIDLRGSASLNLPESVTQVGRIHLDDSTFLELPDGVTQVGDIILLDSTCLTLSKGVTQVGKILLEDSASLILPKGVTQVGDIKLSDSTFLILPEGVTQVERIELWDSASVTIPEGVTQVGNIVLSDSTFLILPEGVTQVGNIVLCDNTSLVLPEGVTQVERIELSDSTSLILPEGVTRVGGIWISNSSSLTIPEGVTQVGNIELWDSTSLAIPEGVTQVGNIELHDSSSLTLPEGVTQVGDIQLWNATTLTLPEGVTQVGGIRLWDSASLTLPKSMTRVDGSVYLAKDASITFPDGFVLQNTSCDERSYSAEEINELLKERSKKVEILQNFKNGDDVLIRKDGNYTLPEGVTQVRCIELWDSASLTLPEGVTQVGVIRLYGSSSLTVPEGVTHVGYIELYDSTSLTLPEGVTRVASIRLNGSSSLTLPDGVTQVEGIRLSGFSSLTIPDGVTQVEYIGLFDSSSLTLPKGVTQVGEIILSGSASLTLPEGVTRVGDITLYDSISLTLPEGVTQVKDIELYDSTSLNLPEGVTQVGFIRLSDSSSLILPEGVTQVENIELWDSASLTIPESVTQVWIIRLNGSSSLTLPEGVTQVESIELYGPASLTLPESMTQVDGSHLYPGSSITFPDGFVLQNTSDRVMHYSAEKMNELLKEHQKKSGKATDITIAFPESEELKTLAKECAARKSFLGGFDYDIGVLNTEKMSDSELYSFVSKNLSVLSIEQLAEAQRILEKWRGIHGMMHENDTIDKRFSKYFAPHCEAVLERTGLDLNELHQSLPQKEFARLIRGQEVLIDGTVNTKEGPSNGLWSFRISPAKPGPDNPGFSFYLYPVEYHDGPNGKIPEHKTLPKGEDLVIKGRHFKAGSDEVEQWRLAGRGIVLETPSGLELVTPGKYDSTVGIARSVSYIEKRLTSLEHADLHLRPFKDDGSIKKEKTKGFQIGGEDIPKLARGEEVVLTTKEGVKACVRYDCGENNLIEVVPFAIAKRMELRDELKQKDKANLEKVIKEVGRPASKNLDNNIRKK